jgi:hypothetical protein
MVRMGNWSDALCQIKGIVNFYLKFYSSIELMRLNKN